MTMPQQGGLTPPVDDDDHAAGPDDAPVTLVEYGDYQCPYCRRAEPVVEAVRRRLGRQLRYVFRHFPLEQLHPLARAAAEAAEAAGAQGRFWPMHAALIGEPEALAAEDLVAHAREIGLDVERFRGELADRTYAPAVDADVHGGLDSGVPGTPTFFLNGRLYQGPVDEGALGDALIDAAQRRVRSADR